jgi:lysophospholipase L1-like esterase
MVRMHLFAPVLVLAACGADPGGDSDDTSGTTGGSATMTAGMTDPTVDPSVSTSATTASTSTTSTTTTTSTTSVDDSSSTGEPPAEPAIHWVGRTDTADPTRTRIGWSGAGFVVRFDGTGVTARMDDAARYFTVVVDGTVQPNLATSPGEQDYVIATGLPAGEHTVEVYRRTEGSFGPTSILSIDIEGELLAPPPALRRIEIIGDSITCGYGNEGASPCSFSAETENHYLTYGAIAARSVGAELSTVAWSGKGIIYNYGNDTNEPLPQVYDRILASDAAPWDFSWQPDVVAVNLGTNDFSTDGDPTQELFVGEYTTFATHLREVYPDAYILLLAPSLFGDELTMVEGYLQQVVDARTGAGDTQIDWANINVEWIGSGCDGHPTVATHEGMAGRLVEELGLHLGW